MLNGLMLEVGTVMCMWLFGLFDVVCGTLKLAFIDFPLFFAARERFSTVLTVVFFVVNE